MADAARPRVDLDDARRLYGHLIRDVHAAAARGLAQLVIGGHGHSGAGHVSRDAAGPELGAETTKGSAESIDTVERTLLTAIRERVPHPAAIRYLVDGVNGHLEGARGQADDERRRLEQQLEVVGTELANVEKAILAGVVADTTAALLRDRETQRELLRKRLQDLDDQRLNAPLRIDDGVIEAHLAELDQVLGQDPEAANAFFRQGEGQVPTHRARRATVLSGLRRGKRRRNHQKPGPSPGF